MNIEMRKDLQSDCRIPFHVNEVRTEYMDAKQVANCRFITQACTGHVYAYADGIGKGWFHSVDLDFVDGE